MEKEIMTSTENEIKREVEIAIENAIYLSAITATNIIRHLVVYSVIQTAILMQVSPSNNQIKGNSGYRKATDHYKVNLR
jgi:hypothetical protein